MAEIINLRQARKARVRAEKERVASANRAKFGQTKAEREARRAQEALMDRRLDGSLREGVADAGEQDGDAGAS